MSTTSETDEEEAPPTECASCGYEGAPLTEYHPPPHRKHEEPRLFCEVCANTPAGNAYDYPQQYQGQSATLRAVAWCTNRILQEIQAAGNDAGRGGES